MHTFSTLSLTLLASCATACNWYDFCRCYDTRYNYNNEDITRKACNAMAGVMAWGDPVFGQRCRKPNLSGHTDEPGTEGFWNCKYSACLCRDWRRECNYQAGTNTTADGGVESHVFVDHCMATFFDGENGKTPP
ncbi:hypothetical protein EJ03DRAFT_382426 [Teratosphaeria nubilosa]|uniref:Uncharacterized protein n=1 Tax=Teratosphaeria nubilosa TaxID=161662 RepID=A0A6G1LAM5_9PEZI|nr:hypothetical protein EJ03DRAFT_382426 [Teratosphaeria nubilosa]